MNKLLKRMGLPALALATLALWSCSTKYEYETVPNDPLQARIYTWVVKMTLPKLPVWLTTSNT